MELGGASPRRSQGAHPTALQSPYDSARHHMRGEKPQPAAPHGQGQSPRPALPAALRLHTPRTASGAGLLHLV